MTNTLYFHNTVREDDSSATEEEDSPSTSRHHTHHHQQQQQGIVVASDWISLTSGLNPEDENKHGKDVVSDSNSKELSSSITPTPWSAGEKLEHFNLKSFSFKELKSATRKFHHGGIVGEGSYGKVFKGWIDVNRLTATKPGKGFAVVINGFNQHPSQRQSELWSEAKYLGRFFHPNLVRLFGYCTDNKQHLLVYDFMPRGSLDDHLFKRDSSPLSWSVRMKIALGAAKGLAFLHRTAVNVIHRGFTSYAILLDLDYNAKVVSPSRYCFTRQDNNVKIALPGNGQNDMRIDPTALDLSTKEARDLGFLAPESAFKDEITAKSDVYSFGAVLLEILSGRRAIDMRLYLFQRANRCSERDIFCFLDSHLAGQYSLEKALKAANLALQCLAERPEFRPNMDDVVATLEEIQVCEDTYRYPTLNDIFR